MTFSWFDQKNCPSLQNLYLQIWVSIVFTIGIFGVLFEMSTDSVVTLSNAVTDMIGDFAGQSSHRTRLMSRIRNRMSIAFSKWFVFQSLLYIWVIAGAVLSRSISSVLLQSYIGAKVSPFIDSLADIAADEHRIDVEGVQLLDVLENEIDDNLWLKLRSKFRRDNNRNEMSRVAQKLNSVAKLRAVLNGELIQLDNSANNREKRLMFPNLALTVGHSKYGKTLFAFFVSKRVDLALNITQL